MQYQLVRAERTILKETLVGCIKALMDVLAITNPVAFGRASRLKRLAIEFAHTVEHLEFWQLEAAAMLSQLGYLSLPTQLVEKLYYGERLTPEEKILAGRSHGSRHEARGKHPPPGARVADSSGAALDG